MTKAQAKLIEHVFTILLGVILLTSIVALVYSFYMNSIKTEIRESLKQIAIYTSDNIINIYKTAKASDAQPSNQTSVLIKEIDLNLPAEVSKRNYEVFLISSSSLWLSITNFTVDEQNVSSIVETSGPKVVAQTTQDPKITVEQSISNIDIALQGRSENGKEGKLRYYRYNINGTIYDSIVLGEADVLIRITASS